jgi:hypothetical protein
VPNQPGVYLILNSITNGRTFLRTSTGGHFKGKDPTVEVCRLESKWVGHARVLNIGKAGPRKTLRSRLNQYMRFGRGEAIGHWDGRYIWQLGHSKSLLVCWKVIPNALPRSEEKALIAKFETKYRRLPFANLRH